MPKTKMVIINGRRYKQTDAARLGLLTLRENHPDPEHKAVQTPATPKPAKKNAAKKKAAKKNEATKNDNPKPAK